MEVGGALLYGSSVFERRKKMKEERRYVLGTWKRVEVWTVK